MKMRRNQEMAKHPHAVLASARIRWLAPVVVLLGGTGAIGTAFAQPCLTCRTERCPTKSDIKAWCGAGKDPLAAERPPSGRPVVERQAIQVASNPAGATVRLGGPRGDILGVTPLKDVVLAHGRYQLWMTLPGYQAAVLEVVVEARGPRQFFASLRPLAEAVKQSDLPPPAEPAKEVQGRLLVRSNRQGAEVRVDGTLLGTTPLPELQLGLGEHQVVGRDAGQELSRLVVLSSKEPVLLELRFPVRRWVWVVTGLSAAAAAGLAIGLGTYYGTSVPKPDLVIGR